MKINEHLQELTMLNMLAHTREHEKAIGNHLIAIRKHVEQQDAKMKKLAETTGCLINEHLDAMELFAHPMYRAWDDEQRNYAKAEIKQHLDAIREHIKDQEELK